MCIQVEYFCANFIFKQPQYNLYYNPRVREDDQEIRAMLFPLCHDFISTDELFSWNIHSILERHGFWVPVVFLTPAEPARWTKASLKVPRPYHTNLLGSQDVCEPCVLHVVVWSARVLSPELLHVVGRLDCRYARCRARSPRSSLF